MRKAESRTVIPAEAGIHPRLRMPHPVVPAQAGNPSPAADVATRWVEMEVVRYKTQERVCAAIQRIRKRLSVPLIPDSDNGTEFINKGLYAYCESNRFTSSKSRPVQKNDSAHVEQKNGAAVRLLNLTTSILVTESSVVGTDSQQSIQIIGLVTRIVGTFSH